MDCFNFDTFNSIPLSIINYEQPIVIKNMYNMSWRESSTGTLPMQEIQFQPPAPYGRLNISRSNPNTELEYLQALPDVAPTILKNKANFLLFNAINYTLQNTIYANNILSMSHFATNIS